MTTLQILTAARELISEENLDVCGSIWRSSGGDAFAEVAAIKAFRAANNICGWIGTWHPKQDVPFLQKAFDRAIEFAAVSEVKP